MTSENTTADVPISNWTLATGTKPGARAVDLPSECRPVRADAAGAILCHQEWFDGMSGIHGRV